ncbi:MAG: acyl-ACP--UDP-N-acetylglucosamine O-acyltransferase [Rhodobacteraceae bacterium]|nr:acyl-ACP--UDP-N-acetylglucosamine O-acyltransferase [Paracoccaceae bacterium]
MSIHPSAIIEDGAEIGPDCHIGPFCHIGAAVRLGAGVRLHSHVAIAGDTVIGEGTEIWPFASVGSQPQDLKFAGEKTRLVIGARNMIRESVSINPGTEGGGGLTEIGDDCLFMLGTHVGHDCHVGNRVVVANHASLAGHVQVGEGAIIGGLAGIHQFVRIGEGAIIGALSMVVADVIPFGSVMGERPRLAGLNLIGLKRRGLPRSEISALRAAYKALFVGEGSLRERAEAMLENADNTLVRDLLEFVLSDSERSFCTPKGK